MAAKPVRLMGASPASVDAVQIAQMDWRNRSILHETLSRDGIDPSWNIKLILLDIP